MTRIYVALALVVLLALGGWWLHHDGYASGKADCEAAQVAASAVAAQAHEARVVKADAITREITDTGAARAASAAEVSHETVRTITRIVHDAPAAAVCVAPADSVRQLTDAAERANASARGVQ